MAQIWQDKINPFPYEEPYEYLGPQPTGHNLENYNPRPTEADATTTVSTGAGLFTAIDNASSGDIIWIDSASTCDVTDQPRYKNVPTGVTIASNGGRVYQSNAKGAVFNPQDNDNIRFTGIRFEGHYIGNLDPYDETEICRAMIVRATNVEIDHCEFFGWTGAGVFVGDNTDTPANHWAPHIHHCRFWDNRMSGLGYGIVVYSGDPDIEYCTFNNNRHSIATGGADECAYDVRDSWHGPNTKIDGFEQHDPGGLRSIVRYCEFADMVKNQSGNTAPVYTQRGTPIETAEIHNNHLHDPQETHATTADLDGQQIIQYDHGSTEFVDVNHYDNHYGETDVPASAGIREPATTSDGGDGTDLTDDIPSEAVTLYQAKPDIRQEYETVSASEYDNRNGDLAELIESAASNGQVVDLGSGEYEMSGVSLYDNACGVVGDGADSCTIHCETGGGYLFNFGAEDPIIEGVTFQASGDVALATVQTGNEGWFDDVVFRGQRNKYDANGERFTFLIQADSGATNLINNCRFPDGGTNHPDNDSVGHAIGPNADPSHEGLNVWRNCLAQGFMDNAFYVNNSPGRNVLWNCTARNNGAGNIRLGQNDYVVGGYSEVTDLPDDRLGKPLEADDGANITVVGLEIYGSGDAYGNEAIQLRSNLQDITLDRVVAHVDGTRRIARLSGDNPDITLRDCYWYDEGNHNESVIYTYGSNVDAENMHVYSPNDELYYTSGSFSHNGTAYEPGTYAASEVGFDDPRPLPSFGFGEGGDETFPTPTGDLSVFAEDAASGQRIDGAEVTVTWLEDDPHPDDETGPHTGTTGNSTVAAGGVDFGQLPVGYYRIEVTHPDYEMGAYGPDLWRNEGETTNEAMHLDTEGRLPIIYLTPTDGGGGEVEQWTEQTIDSDEFGDGVAIFEDLPVSPPDYDIRATHSSHQAATYNDLTLDASGRQPVITLANQLDADTLSVQITTGDDDTPVADATVTLYRDDGN